MSDYRVFGIGIKNIEINEGTLMSEEEAVSYRLLNDELKIDFSSKGNSDTFINKSTDWYIQEESSVGRKEPVYCLALMNSQI